MKKFLTAFFVLVLTLSMSCYGAPPEESASAVQEQAVDNTQTSPAPSLSDRADADSVQGAINSVNNAPEQAADAVRDAVEEQTAPVSVDEGSDKAEDNPELEDKKTDAKRTRSERRQSENEEETEEETQSQETSSSISLTSIIILVVLVLIAILLIVILIMVASVSKTAKNNKAELAELSEITNKINEIATVIGSEFNNRISQFDKNLETNGMNMENISADILSIKNTIETKMKSVQEERECESAPGIKTDYILYNEYLEGKVSQPPESFKKINICTNGKHLMVTDYDDGFGFYISSDEKYIYPIKENMDDFMVSNMGNSIIEFSKSKDGVKRVNAAALVRISGSDRIIQIFTKGTAEY